MPPPRHPSREPDSAKAAAEWLVRFDAGGLDPDGRMAFQSWLQDPENLLAWRRAQDAWNIFGGPVDHDSQALHRLAMSRHTPRAQRARRWAAGAGIAAAVLVVLGAGVALQRAGVIELPGSLAPARQLYALGGADYVTAVGERTATTLPDGTTVTLNTDTAIDVSYTDGQRSVVLLRGQAFFDVAHDAARPFVVRAADRTITALGTAFEVRLDPGRFRVLLVEGQVAVEREDPAAAHLLDAPVVETILTPGQELVAALGAPEHVASANVERDLRWRDGFVEFDDAPLAAALAEMNRYAATPIMIQDPRAASLRLSGIFRTGQPEQFAALVGEFLPVVAETGVDGSIQIRMTSPASGN
jgi:transmembrane sensor